MRRIIALLSVPVLLAGGMLLTTGSSSAEDAPQITTGGLQDRGAVVLRTGWFNGSVSYTGESGTTTRNFGSGCSSALDAGALIVTGTGGACFGTAGLGAGPGRNGAPTYLNPNTLGSEALTLSLAGPASEFEISRMSLDIEAVGVGTGSDIIVSDGAGNRLAEIDLLTRIPGILFPNYRVNVELAVPSNTVVFSSANGTIFQLEGDTGTTGSVFFLTDVPDVLPCDGTPVESNSATLTIKGGDGCSEEPVFFEFDTESNEVLLLKEASDNEFTLNVPWVDLSAEAAYPGRTTQIDYFDGAGFQNMTFCDVSGDTPQLPADLILPLVPDAPPAEWDGWCIADREIPTDNGDGTFTTVETLYGKGDPRMR
jgi:hypothetical protein